jgi:hypothetical protein
MVGGSATPGAQGKTGRGTWSGASDEALAVVLDFSSVSERRLAKISDQEPARLTATIRSQRSNSKQDFLLLWCSRRYWHHDAASAC